MFYKEIALDPVFWRTDYINTYTKTVKFPAELNWATVHTFHPLLNAFDNKNVLFVKKAKESGFASFA